ncbi:MAG TPA: DUF4956 domain-containing protein [Chloroflexi bacterium]|nr:DUF4956 domain-containing protein [Chloroflexota bacterium]
MENWFDFATHPSTPLSSLIVNLLLGIFLSSMLAWYYARYGKSLSNRARLAHFLPLLTLTTVLVISITKVSLALSLGALSIIRFRTAIKEPEELMYLFIAIATGLGLGADQRLTTLGAMLVILGYLLVRALVTPGPLKNNLYLNVSASWPDASFSQINQILLQHVDSVDLRRLDRDSSTLQATYLIDCSDDETLSALMDDLSARLPRSEISFVEQDNTLIG